MSHRAEAMTMNDCARLPRGGILVSGDDAAVFLQGLISNDIRLLEHGDAAVLYAAFLTPQGRFLHDALIYRGPDGFLIETQASARCVNLAAHLQKYRLRAKVDWKEIPITVWGGPGVTPPPQGSCADENAIRVMDPRHPDLGWRVVVPGTDDAPPPAGYRPVPFSAYDEHRIALGVPDGDRDAEIGVSTLEELNIPRLNGVSFTKGCYVGQELTARMEHRGLAKRHLKPMRVDAVPDGAELRSHCGDIGLALIRD